MTIQAKLNRYLCGKGGADAMEPMGRRTERWKGGFRQMENTEGCGSGEGCGGLGRQWDIPPATAGEGAAIRDRMREYWRTRF